MIKARKFSTLQVLATAVAAYEHNQFCIHRNPVVVDNLNYLSNRQLIDSCMNGDAVSFVVTQDHQKQAERIKLYLEQTVIMQSLRGSADRFLNQLSDMINTTEITNREFGLVAWAPHLYDQYQKKDFARELSAQYEYLSHYLGRVKEKVTVPFTLIEKRYVQSTNCYAVYGVTDQNNLIFYWAKNLDRVCEVGKISGRVKAHRQDEYRNNAKVTILNYVKVL